jgi:hypothetical protein
MALLIVSTSLSLLDVEFIGSGDGDGEGEGLGAFFLFAKSSYIIFVLLYSVFVNCQFIKPLENFSFLWIILKLKKMI